MEQGQRKEKIDIAIIGGGASGLIAGISAAKYLRVLSIYDYNITIFEKNAKIGKKLLLTGNGRCNITNLQASLKSRSCYLSQNLEQMENVLTAYSPQKTLDFFAELGLMWKVLEKDKVYPYSLTASSVLDVLRFQLEDLNIKIESETTIQDIKTKEDGFSLQDRKDRNFFCPALLVATGGLSAPQTGSDGDGYRFITSFGHLLVSTFPALVQLKSSHPFCKAFTGLKFLVAVTLEIEQTQIGREEGEILFTDYGISGPPIILLSNKIASAIDQSPKCKSEIWLKIDFCPEVDLKQLKQYLFHLREQRQNWEVEDFLVGAFHKRLGLKILKAVLQRPLTGKVASITSRELENLTTGLKLFLLPIDGTLSWQQSQATGGGISLANFSATDLQSQIKPGLFACGEVLDVLGDCGGFNLQWAWSSGLLAGEGAANYLLGKNYFG